jgi:hypothetical protein
MIGFRAWVEIGLARLVPRSGALIINTPMAVASCPGEFKDR